MNDIIVIDDKDVITPQSVVIVISDDDVDNGNLNCYMEEYSEEDESNSISPSHSNITPRRPSQLTIPTPSPSPVP